MATTVSLKPNAVEISGSTSGTTTLQATAVAGTTTLTLPAATDTLVGKATTDTLTNKTLTGAAMNGTLGATTPSTGAFTTVSASGQGAINSAIATNSTFQVAGTYAGTGGLFDGGLFVNVDGGTMGVNRTISQSYFGYGPDNAASTITTAASGTNDISTITIFPYVITSGGATLTNATTLAINDAPNLGTNKRAIWVKAGLSQLDGGLAVTGLTDISAATSGQIKFPATQNASTDANTLDDYEEGTFTPTCALATPGTSATTSAVGVYTKIGNLVTVTGRLTFTKGTGTGDLSFGGLPFTTTSTTTYQNSGALSLDSFGAALKVYFFFLVNSTTAPIMVSSTQAGGTVALAGATDFGAAGAGIRYTFSYQID